MVKKFSANCSDEALFIDAAVERRLAKSVEQMLAGVCGSGPSQCSDHTRKVNASAWGLYVSREFLLTPKLASRVVMSHCPRLGLDLIELDADFAHQSVSLSVARAIGEHVLLDDQFNEQDWDFAPVARYYKNASFREVAAAVSSWIRTVMSIRGVDERGVNVKYSLDNSDECIVFTW